MNRKVPLIYCALFSLASYAGILHAENSGVSKTPVVVGQWTISADRDEGGHFIACSATATAPDSQSVINIMILANADLWLTLANISWQFDSRPFPVRLRVDSKDFGTRTMTPVDAKSGYINLGSDRNTQMVLEGGQMLEAVIGSDAKKFLLKDIDKAFGELINCAMVGTRRTGR